MRTNGVRRGRLPVDGFPARTDPFGGTNVHLQNGARQRSAFFVSRNYEKLLPRILPQPGHDDRIVGHVEVEVVRERIGRGVV